VIAPDDRPVDRRHHRAITGTSMSLRRRCAAKPARLRLDPQRDAFLPDRTDTRISAKTFLDQRVISQHDLDKDNIQ
jgi:hypothetical protein